MIFFLVIHGQNVHKNLADTWHIQKLLIEGQGLLCMYVKELKHFPTILNHCPVYKTLPVSPLMFCIQSLLTLVNSVQLCEFQTWIIGKLWRTWLIGTPPSCQWWKEHHMRVSGDVAAVVIWFSSNETNKRQTTPWPTSLLTVSDWARDWTHEQMMTDPSTNPMVDPKISPMINPMTETMTGTMSPWHTPRPTPWLYPLLTPKIAKIMMSGQFRILAIFLYLNSYFCFWLP